MKHLREHYSRLRDEKLLQIAESESSDLTPEAWDCLVNEIHRRNLAGVLEKKGIVIKKPLTEKELDLLVLLHRTRPCPSCGSPRGINGMKIERISGLIIMTKFHSDTYTGCADCLKNEFIASLWHNMLIGWWSFHGLFSTIPVIAGNLIQYIKARKETPTAVFRQITEENYKKEKDGDESF